MARQNSCRASDLGFYPCILGARAHSPRLSLHGPVVRLAGAPRPKGTVALTARGWPESGRVTAASGASSVFAGFRFPAGGDLGRRPLVPAGMACPTGTLSSCLPSAAGQHGDGGTGKLAGHPPVPPGCCPGDWPPTSGPPAPMRTSPPGDGERKAMGPRALCLRRRPGGAERPSTRRDPGDSHMGGHNDIRHNQAGQRRGRAARGRPRLRSDHLRVDSAAGRRLLQHALRHRRDRQLARIRRQRPLPATGRGSAWSPIVSCSTSPGT